MLDFEEELSRFKPSVEVGSVEEEIKKEDLTDVSDLIITMLKDRKE